MAQVIIVGGGLAGLSAAHTLLERGADVLLLDKQGWVYLIIKQPKSHPSPVSWVVTPPRPLQESTAQAHNLSRTSAFPTT